MHPTANGQPVLATSYQGENGTYTCHAYVLGETPGSDLVVIVFQSTSPVNIPPHKRVAVAEYLTRVNWSSVLGTFSMDFDEGEIRCRSSLVTNSVPPVAGYIRKLVIHNVVTMDQYFPALMAIIYSGVAPQQAFEQFS